MLNKKIVEYMKKFGPTIENRYNEVANAFEIICLQKGKVRRVFFRNWPVFLMIKGKANEFTIVFNLESGGNLQPTPTYGGGRFDPVMREGSRLESLRVIENFVYKLANTAKEESNDK